MTADRHETVRRRRLRSAVKTMLVAGLIIAAWPFAANLFPDRERVSLDVAALRPGEALRVVLAPHGDEVWVFRVRRGFRVVRVSAWRGDRWVEDDDGRRHPCGEPRPSITEGDVSFVCSELPGVRLGIGARGSDPGWAPLEVPPHEITAGPRIILGDVPSERLAAASREVVSVEPADDRRRD